MEDGVLEGTRRPAAKRGLGRGLGAILPARGVPPLPQHVSTGGFDDTGAAESRSTRGATRVERVLAQIDEILEDARLEGTAVTVVVFGLDGFRHVNAAYGHDIGDVVLDDLAGRIAGSRRAGDLAARLRGDEFVVVCPRSSGAVERVVARLAQEIERPATVSGSEHTLRATIGVTVTEPGAPRCSARSLLGEADLAMHRAKDDGARWARFDPTMQRPGWEQPLPASPPRPSPEPAAAPAPAAGRTAGVSTALRTGAARTVARSSVRYRPVVEGHSRLVTGARSSVPHGDLPLERMCADLRGWEQAAGLPSGFRIWLDLGDGSDRAQQAAPPSVPVAQAPVAMADRLSALGDAIGSAAVDAPGSGASFAVVLRGRAAASAVRDAAVRAELQRLVDSGLVLGVDVGLASSAPVDLVQLFGALWVPASLGSAEIRGIVGLGRELRLDVVAEGVDTEELAVALAAAGVTHATGSRFGGPLSSERFAGLLWASVGAHQAARWNTSARGRVGRPADVEGRSPATGWPRSTAPT